MFLTGADDGFNPALTLSLVGEMRLLKNGIEVKRLPLSTPLPLTGAARTLRAWVADDAQSFKEGIADQLEKLAGDVVSKLLLRPIPQPSQPSVNELLPQSPSPKAGASPAWRPAGAGSPRPSSSRCQGLGPGAPSSRSGSTSASHPTASRFRSSGFSANGQHGRGGRHGATRQSETDEEIGPYRKSRLNVLD